MSATVGSASPLPESRQRMDVVRDSDMLRRGGDVLGDGARGGAALCGGERGAISKSGSSVGSLGLASDSCARAAWPGSGPCTAQTGNELHFCAASPAAAQQEPAT